VQWHTLFEFVLLPSEELPLPLSLCEEPSLEEEVEGFAGDLLLLAATTSRLPKLPLDLFRGVFRLFLLDLSVSVPPAPDV